MPHTIGLLIFPDFQILDATGPLSAFDIARRYVPGAYDLHLLAVEPGLVPSSSGVVLQAEGIAPPPMLDTLIVAGGDGVRNAAGDPHVLDFVRTTAKRAQRVASVCSGTYVLAAAGLLDGLRATTHWSRSSDFARRFPKVHLDADCIYIKQGAIWTSAGITAGIDLALAMIGEDLGEKIARSTAQQLVVYHRRPGGQSQFSALLELENSEGKFGPLLRWARERLQEPLNVEQLADRAAMSPRNFTRTFTAETGVTPARAVERLRVDAARALVETGQDSVDAIAAAVGFGNSERMRRAFVRAFGQPPQAMRRTMQT